MNFDRLLQQKFIGTNQVEDWLLFAGIILGALLFRTLLARLITRFIFRFFRKTESDRVGFEKLFALVRKPWNMFLLLIAVYIATRHLSWPPKWHMAPPHEFGIRMAFERTLLIALEISFTWILLRLTDFFGLLLKNRAEQTPGMADDQLVPFLRESIKVVIVIVAFFFMLGSVFHMNIASLIAGLGIGGIAVALAAKESLENLFASFTIFLDKPFTVGDQIQMGTQTGVIERIGFRSTRVRAEDRSYVTVPNRKMVENEVFNLSLRNARRVRTVINLTFQTSPEQLRKIVHDITDMLSKHPKVDIHESRVSFFELSPSAFEIHILYFLPDLDPDIFLKAKEEINYSITEIVHRNGAAFAYPSTSVYVERK
jgi:MscS family membrane protein